MKIKHLKNQLRTFTLVSGRSLYLYPMAKSVEISEQDFYLSKKLQRYVKDQKAVEIQHEEQPKKPEPKKMEPKKESQKPKAEKSKKNKEKHKQFKSEKQRALEE